MSADPFALPRQLHPGSKFVRFVDTRTGNEFVMEVPPESGWFPMLPNEQTSHILQTVLPKAA